MRKRQRKKNSRKFTCWIGIDVPLHVAKQHAWECAEAMEKDAGVKCSRIIYKRSPCTVECSAVLYSDDYR
jgi:hypothetical protein